MKQWTTYNALKKHIDNDPTPFLKVPEMQVEFPTSTLTIQTESMWQLWYRKELQNRLTYTYPLHGTICQHQY